MTFRDFLRGVARPAILPLVILACIGVSALAQSIVGGGGGGGSGGTPSGSAGGGLSGTYPNPTLNFGGTVSGIVPSANGGAGTVNGALAGNGSGAVSQAACASLSNATAACSQVTVAPTAWTPSDASGAGLTLAAVSASYVRMGNMMFVYAQFTYPTTADGTGSAIAGLPVDTPNQQYARQCHVTYTTETTLAYAWPFANSGSMRLYNTAGVNIINSALSGDTVQLLCIYPVV